MKEAYTSIIENKSLYNVFEVQIQLPGIEERAISRCHFNIVKKTLNARAGSIFKLFHDKFIGHYSKHLSVVFRTALQAKTESSKHKTFIKQEKEEEHECT